jgi:uncharacterized short protein YbdD (DUF466 family)
MKAAFGAFWTFLRAWSGDSAYDTYARRQQALGNTPLSREAFYLDALQRKYSGVSRCC